MKTEFAIYVQNDLAVDTKLRLHSTVEASNSIEALDITFGKGTYHLEEHAPDTLAVYYLLDTPYMSVIVVRGKLPLPGKEVPPEDRVTGVL